MKKENAFACMFSMSDSFSHVCSLSIGRKNHSVRENYIFSYKCLSVLCKRFERLFQLLKMTRSVTVNTKRF